MKSEMRMKWLIIDPERCTGCQLCVVACSLKNEMKVNPLHARISVARFESKGAYIPAICQQCEKPLCREACPTKATEKNPETRVMTVDHNKCIGCRNCILACPFRGTTFNSKSRKIIKCDLCGGEPLCVEVCTREALAYVPATEAHLRRQMAAAEKFSEMLRKTF